MPPQHSVGNGCRHATQEITCPKSCSLRCDVPSFVFVLLFFFQTFPAVLLLFIVLFLYSFYEWNSTRRAIYGCRRAAALSHIIPAIFSAVTKVSDPLLRLPCLLRWPDDAHAQEVAPLLKLRDVLTQKVVTLRKDVNCDITLVYFFFLPWTLLGLHGKKKKKSSLFPKAV